MAIKVIQQSFTGGEMSPSMYGRFDDQKYQTGLARCENFIVMPQGPIENRPGFEFVRAAKYADRPCRLIPFSWSTDQTAIIELGDKYARFHTRGATILNPDGTPYEISTPYSYADLFDIHYAQSADVLTLVHPGYAPMELRRYGATDWRLVSISFASPIAAPGGLTGSYSCNNSSATDEQKNMYSFRYRVTAITDTDDGDRESEASGTCIVNGNIYLDFAKITLSWNAVSGASRYRVYKTVSGIYGYIGETTDTSFTDDNIKPDQSISLPRYDNPFWSGNYPSAVSYFEQRRVFAGTYSKPQMVWMTRPGTESSMVYTIPQLDDNRIKFRIAALDVSRIEHIVPLTSLVLLTPSAEFRVTTANDDMITPKSIGVKPQSYVGASSVQPVIANNSLIYATSRGGHVREMGYNWQASGFVTGDLSIRAPHLFENRTIRDMALSKAPFSVVWAVQDNGKLLGCTYLPDQGVGAWHQHTTKNGAFESVAVVAEGLRDAVYVSVRRTINGATVRFIERMQKHPEGDIVNAFYVDAGLTYSGGAVSKVSGLGYLEGEIVAILADGKVMPEQKVTNGSVTLPISASTITIGLPIEAKAQTLPIAYNTRDGGSGQGRDKNIVRFRLRVYQSSALWAGPNFSDLRLYKQRTTEPYGAPPYLMSKEAEILLTPSWNDTGTVCIEQKYPLPVMVCGINGDVES